MEIWVLVIMLVGYTSQSGQAIHSQEFDGRQNCEIAKSTITKELPKQSPMTILYTQCFLKKA